MTPDMNVYGLSSGITISIVGSADPTMIGSFCPSIILGSSWPSAIDDGAATRAVVATIAATNNALTTFLSVNTTDMKDFGKRRSAPFFEFTTFPPPSTRFNDRGIKRILLARGCSKRLSWVGIYNLNPRFFDTGFLGD